MVVNVERQKSKLVSKQLSEESLEVSFRIPRCPGSSTMMTRRVLESVNVERQKAC
jgi:hypothetical protein